MCIQTRWKIWWFDVNIHCVIIILIKLIAIPITTTYIIGWIHLRKQVEMQSNTPGLSGLSKELHGIYFILVLKDTQWDFCVFLLYSWTAWERTDPLVYSLWNHSGKGKAIETGHALEVDKNCCVVKRDEKRKHRRI